MKDDRRFGAYVRIHRTLKHMKLEAMAAQLKLNKGKLSKLETGSMPWSDEDQKNVLAYLGVSYHTDIDRMHVQEKLVELYEMYAKLNKESMQYGIQRILDTVSLKYSICFVEYDFIQYMQEILMRKDISCSKRFKHTIQELLPYFSKLERLIYYDLHGLQLYDKQQYEEAVPYFQKVAKAKHEVVSMMGYAHLNLVYSQLGNYQKAMHCIHKAITAAITTVSLKRLPYFIYHKANTYVHGLYIEEAKALYCQLLQETEHIEDALAKDIYRDLAYISLFEKDYKSSISYAKKALQLTSSTLDLYIYLTYSYYMLEDVLFLTCLSYSIHACVYSDFHSTFLESLWFLYTGQHEYAIAFMKDCVEMSNRYFLDERIWMLDVLKYYAEKVEDINLVHQCTQQLLDVYRKI